MTTILDLKHAADRALFADRFSEALAGYTRIVELQPGNLDARLRVGDALIALGELQRGAVVYTALARHAALAGYPLRALVALKILSSIEPRLGVLLADIARMYARDSDRLGRSVRRALPSSSQALPAGFTPELRLVDPSSLAAYAERIACDYTTSELVYPERLMPIPLLSLFATEEFGTLLSALRLLRARPETVILREGDPGTSFYVLARGSVDVRAQRSGRETALAKLAEGSIFGEMALLSAAPRTASVLAHDDCDLLEFDCSELSHATSTLQSLGQTLEGFARERLINNVFATSALFKPLDGKQRMDLMRRFVSVDAAPGESLIREGDPGRGLFVVLRGEVVVTRAEGDTSLEGVDLSRSDVPVPGELARLGPSEVFGEIALLNQEPATATVRAARPGTTVLFLSRDYFERLITAVPELRAYFERLSEDRLMDQRISRMALEAYEEPEEFDVELK
ncbi:MAG TPA: cyclic nucleotide-binding domain-containing protein [Polyangiales bacterium]|nr:cyclic nucleotide-binding domain-containing protein [Polyangiales bacterium]